MDITFLLMLVVFLLSCIFFRDIWGLVEKHCLRSVHVEQAPDIVIRSVAYLFRAL